MYEYVYCSYPERMLLTAEQRQRSRHAKWFLKEVPHPLNMEECVNSIHEMFKVWTTTANVSAENVTEASQADLILEVGPIDGPGGTLAYMELPGPRPQRGKFDSSERWVIRIGQVVNPPQINKAPVDLHELGHFWGLPHSDDPNDIMYYRYSPQILMPGDWSKRQMQLRYGKPLSPPTTPPVPPGFDEPDQMVIIGKSGRETYRAKLIRM